MPPVKEKRKPTGTRKPPKEKSPETDPSSAWKVNDETGKRERSTRALPLETRLREFFAGLSGVAMLAGDSFTAEAISAKGEELAYGYAKLAQTDPRVKRVLTMLLEGSAWTEAVVPTVGLVIVVGWHYGFIPDQLGMPMTMANGLPLVTREGMAQARAEHEAAQARSQGNGGPDAGGSAS